MEFKVSIEKLIGPAIILALVVVIGAGAGVYGVRAFFGSEVMCASCHSDMDMSGTKDSGHPDAASCWQCHENTVNNMAKKYGPMDAVTNYVPHWFSTDDDMVNENCLRCHQEIQFDDYDDDSPKVIKVSHRKHMGEGLVCTDCHYNVAHNKNGDQGTYRPQKSDCYRCHLRDIEGSARDESCKKCHYIILERAANTTDIP